MAIISIQTPYLVNPIEDCHQITLDLDFETGTGRMMCDPNLCSLGAFGDRQICTRIAVQTTDITLERLEIADVSDQERQLYNIAGSPLSSSLSLVAPKDNDGDFRLVQTQINGERRVVSTEPIAKPIGSCGNEDLVCTPLTREVNGQVAQADLRPGFVTNTVLLIVGGQKPNLNTEVMLQPLVYVQQPEYWGFKVLDCQRGDITLPAISEYMVSLDVTSQLGTKGVEVIWANGESVKIDLPAVQSYSQVKVLQGAVLQ
ncbi:MAG: hypothetical protein AAF703_10065 [Cyanobacteria bacterium P01_D01_bin.105]